MSESVAVSVSSGAADSTYEPSWLHRAVAWFERLPGPTWIAYLALFVVNTLFWHLIPWAKGSVPVGTLDAPSLYWGLQAPALLWIAGYLQRGAAASFDAFRSILVMPPDEAERLRHTLLVLPARPAWVITALAGVLTVVGVLAEPATYTIGVLPPLVVGEFLVQTATTSMLFMLLYWLIRQTALVRRTLARSVAIDVFRPGPLHAVATLTSRPGIAISLLVAAAVLIIPIPSSFETFLVGAAPYLVVPPVIAIIAFVLPLTGAHARLVEQKEQLRDDAERRLEAILAELNRDVDARELDRADGLNKTLASLTAQREILAKLPTWPWSTATLRGFVSALLLPMVLFLIQQALSRVF